MGRCAVARQAGILNRTGFVPALPSSGYFWIWMSVAAMALADCVLSMVSGLTIVFPLLFVFPAAFLGLVALVYGPIANRDRRIFELANANILLVLITTAGLVMNIEAAWFGRGLVNNWLDAADKTMGFDWLAVARAMDSRVILADVLRIAYLGFIPEVFLIANLLAFFGDKNRIVELAGISVVALVITNLVFWLFPADNADTFYGGHVDGIHQHWSSMLMALRNHSADRFKLEEMQGLISFPSFHTTMAVALVYINRGKVWFLPSLAFNIAMLMAVTTFGGHYLIDMLAGAVVALFSVVGMRWPMVRAARSGLP